MRRFRWLALAGVLAWSGCSRTVTPDIMPEDDPTGERRLEQMLMISSREREKWPPAMTAPLAPVLLAADTSIKVAVATEQWVEATISMIREFLFGTPVPRPDAVDRAAESLHQK